MLSHLDLRRKFIEFYTDSVRKHVEIQNSPLVPQNDPTTLFTGSGMQPLIPYLLGEPHPEGKRLVNIQKCIRAEDLDEVGETPVHHTFFEMMGNWSLGDYFKKEQIGWSLEFFVNIIGLSVEKLYVSVFQGDAKIPKDTESLEIWKKEFKKYGITAEEGDIHLVGKGNLRIFSYPRNKNWWERSGAKAGDPAGPDSEIFYDTGRAHDPKYGDLCHVNCNCRRFIEICNNVFMQYEKQEDGSYKPLKKNSVDVGYGFERVLLVANGMDDDYETDVFSKVVERVEKLSGKTYGESDDFDKCFRIIADHIRTSVFLTAEDVLPSNKEHGYLLRRLVRRAIRFAKKLGIKKGFSKDLAGAVIETFKEPYPHLLTKKEQIISELLKEEERFGDALEKGLKKLEHLLAMKGTLSGEDAFMIYETYGFPLELIIEVAKEVNVEVDTETFNKAFEKHKEKSKLASEVKFKGGLEGTSEMHIKYHTATHLLHQALRDTLGSEVRQMGSNITTERLRFDFSFDRKMTEEEIKKVEEIVNGKISEDLPVSSVDLSKEEAEKSGALHFFGEKYGETVKVYCIGKDLKDAYSKEYCGGPHVKNTGELGRFKILKEEASSKGVRRIKAVLS